MIRFLFRLAGALVLVVAVILAVLDATRTVAASALVLTALSDSWASALPQSFATFQAFIKAHAGESVWSGIIAPLLGVPGFFLLGLLSFLLFAVGWKREERPSGFGRNAVQPMRRRRV